LLLTTDRDNLVRLFSRRGYRTIAAIPGLRTSWPEGSFYNFDRLFDADGLEYRGPAFGYWRIPDQYTMSRVTAEESLLDQQSVLNTSGRFVFAAMVSSHIPFRPVPPYQPQWDQLLTDNPYDPAAVETSLSQLPNWLALREPYVDSIRYSWQWLADLVDQTRASDATLLIVGDHQPAASVIGKNQSWDVPVHLVSSNPRLLQRALQLGFQEGLTPHQEKATQPMHSLTKDLLRLLDGPMQALAR
jgi:hypothetical protein